MSFLKSVPEKFWSFELMALPHIPPNFFSLNQFDTVPAAF
jgi:hypothetical protein